MDATKKAKTYHVQLQWETDYLSPITDVLWTRQLFLDQLTYVGWLSHIWKSSSLKYRSTMTDKHLEAGLLPTLCNQLQRLHSWLWEASHLLTVPGLWLS